MDLGRGAVALVVAGLLIAGCGGAERPHAGPNGRPVSAQQSAQPDRSRASDSSTPRQEQPSRDSSSKNPGSSPTGSPGQDARGGSSVARGSSQKESPGSSTPQEEKPSTGGGAHGKRSDQHVELLDLGDQGKRVRALQRKLRRLHYDPGVVDGVFGGTTQYAVWAFQKAQGLDADGVVGPKTRAALADPETPDPLVPGGPGDRVEIDLTHQLLYVYENGQLALISHISSGSEDPYCTADGHCGDAVTPTGDFSAIWRVDGWRESDLGRLYNPVYFAAGGFAVHGAPHVPLYPASHGCVRIPMHTAEIFPDLVEEDEAVYVRSPG